jgi:hypothetical protein
MFLIIHALLGALIGLEFHSIWLIAITALISHFILDSLPHWDGYFDRKLFYLTGKANLDRKNMAYRSIDWIIAFIIVIVLYRIFNDSTPLLIGAIFSMLPDLSKLFYVTRIRKHNLYMSFLQFHAKIQRDINWKWGILFQLLLAVLMIMAIYNKLTAVF